MEAALLCLASHLTAERFRVGNAGKHRTHQAFGTPVLDMKIRLFLVRNIFLGRQSST
jgi:hypothetical protein